MADKQTIREWKSFYISEFRAEEAWLSFMHQQGWKLQSIDKIGFHYTFEACEPQDWIYQLDFKEDGVAEEDYILMYEDYGWELVLRFRHWFYFRKLRTGDMTADDMAIFGSCFGAMFIGNQFKRLNHMIRQMESPLA